MAEKVFCPRCRKTQDVVKTVTVGDTKFCSACFDGFGGWAQVAALVTAHVPPAEPAPQPDPVPAGGGWSVGAAPSAPGSAEGK